jgi:hypothetical protein
MHSDGPVGEEEKRGAEEIDDASLHSSLSLSRFSSSPSELVELGAHRTCNSFSKLHEIVAAAPIYKLHELGAAWLGATAPSSWSSELRCSEL